MRHLNKKQQKQQKQKNLIFNPCQFITMKTIHLELKKAIFDYMIENHDLFNLVNHTIDHFREYIYNSEGNYLIGGENVANFIEELNKLI